MSGNLLRLLPLDCHSLLQYASSIGISSSSTWSLFGTPSVSRRLNIPRRVPVMAQYVSDYRLWRSNVINELFLTKLSEYHYKKTRPSSYERIIVIRDLMGGRTANDTQCFIHCNERCKLRPYITLFKCAKRQFCVGFTIVQPRPWFSSPLYWRCASVQDGDFVTSDSAERWLRS